MSPHEPDDRCQEVLSALSEYLDLELPPDACRELEAHLHDCPPCVEFLNSLRRTIGLIRESSPLSELPDPLGEDARRQLQDAYRRMLLAQAR